MNDRLEIASRLLAAQMTGRPEDLGNYGYAMVRSSLDLANILIEEDKKSKIEKDNQNEN
jgi:hypothetical protein